MSNSQSQTRAQETFSLDAEDGITPFITTSDPALQDFVAPTGDIFFTSLGAFTINDTGAQANGDFTLTSYSAGPIAEPGPIPEPASLALFGAGLAGIAGVRRRRARWFLAAATAVCMASASGARADVIVQFTLDGIETLAGGSVTGDFTIDETNQILTKWDIMFSGIPATREFAFTLNDANSSGSVGLDEDGGTVLGFNNEINLSVSLFFPQQLADVSVPIVLDRNDEDAVIDYVEGQDYDDQINGGAVDTTVPEPSALALVAAGLAGIAVVRRRRARG